MVTGGVTGLGRGFVEKLLSRGARVSGKTYYFVDDGLLMIAINRR